MVSQGHSDAAVEVVSSLAKMSLLAMAQVVEDMDDNEITSALETMLSDPEYVISSTNDSGALNWDAFEAGGPLAPDHVEIRIGSAVTGITDKKSLLTLLRRFDAAEDGLVSATKWFWLHWWRPSGLPACLVALMPCPFGNRAGLGCIIRIGETRLANAFLGQKPEVIQQALKAEAADRLDTWFTENEKRPMSDHPGFDIFVQKPAAGLPGLCAVRMPMPPFTPIMPLETWTQRYGVNVFETVNELAEIERFYQTPRAAFHRALPFIRNRPPPSFRPATFTGIPREMQVIITQTSWPDGGCAWCWIIPNEVLNAFPKVREMAHRGRYLARVSRDLDTAKAEIRKLTGKSLDQTNIFIMQSTRHPNASLPWRAPKSGLHRHVIVGNTLDGRDAYALTVLSRYQDHPAVLAAAADAEEFRSAVSAFTTTYHCQPTDVAEVLSGPNAPSIGLVVLDQDAVGFAVAALPDREEGAEALASVIACVALHRDQTDLPCLAETRTLAERTGAKLLLVLVGSETQAPGDKAFNAAVIQIKDELLENFRVFEMPPPPPASLAEMAAEILSRPSPI
jgi:hypothetical protein